jgi:hypothetical protein
MQPIGPPGAGAFLTGVAPSHAAALLVPLLLPPGIWCFLEIVELAARVDLPLAQKFRRGYAGSSSLTRAIALLLVLAGAVHLALAPGHLGVDQPLALLFALNGIAFLGLGIWPFVGARWRPMAAGLLGATLVAYLFYLGSGRESPDLVGTATYLIELVTLGLVWIPRTTDSDRAELAWIGSGVDQRARRTADTSISSASG